MKKQSSDNHMALRIATTNLVTADLPRSVTLRDKQADRSQKHSFLASRQRYRHASLLLMAAPGVILLFIFSYIPLVGLLIAFKDFNPIDGIINSPWVGLDNFRYLFSTPDARTITFNTLFMNSIFIVTSLVASIGIALLLDEVRDGSKFLARFYQGSLFFPFLLSYTVVNYFVYAFLNADHGLVNHFLSGLGLPSVNWYQSPQYWPFILTVVNLWKGAGFWSVVYLAGIIGINPEYYEAARIDGASKLQEIRSITLPLLMPIITVSLLLSIGRIFYADFGLFFQVTRDQGLLYPTTNVIDTYVYHALIALGDVGQASAAGMYQAVIGFVLVFLSNWTVRRIDPDKSLF